MDFWIAVILFIISLISYILYDYLYGSGAYWKNRGIPCLGGALPLVGHMWRLASVQENFIFMYNKFYSQMNTSMFGVYNFGQPILVIRDAEIVKTLLVNSFGNFTENSSKLDPALDPLLSTNPFYTHGDRWKSQRAIFHSALTNKQLKVIALQIDEVCTKFKKYLISKTPENGEAVLEAGDIFPRFTADVVATAAFGINGKSFTDDPHSFRNVARIMFEPGKFNEFIGSLAIFFPLLRKIFRLRFMPYVVDRHFRKILNEVVPTRKGLKANDFLQQIIDVYEQEGNSDDVDFIPGHSASFFLDGYITTSLTMEFVCYHIASYPKVQEKIRTEVTQILDRCDDKITFESLQEMKYLEQVVDEAMRLFPALGYIGKLCTETCKLVGYDGLECTVEPGTEIIIPAIGLHRDPRYWDNPEQFDPDRFDEENKKNQHKYAFVPFGAGPRICLGRKVAMMQIKAAMATLIRNYSLDIDSKTKQPITVHPMSALFTIPENSLWIKTKPLT